MMILGLKLGKRSNSRQRKGRENTMGKVLADLGLIRALLLSAHKMLGNCLTLYEPHFPLLWSDDSNTHSPGLFSELREIMYC